MSPLHTQNRAHPLSHQSNNILFTHEKLEVKSDEYTHTFNFPHEIIPETSKIIQNNMNIQVVLAKKNGENWTDVLVNNNSNDPSATMPKGYPSSARNKTDFAKIDREYVEDKAEGEAAVNELFKSIYANGAEDTKRAMMKSWTESGGTCLSTNWEEVGKNKVEVKPPTGMEAKKWDQ